MPSILGGGLMARVAFTNFANWSFVTSVLSIQNPSTEARCQGWASGNSSAPIQNSPPGIQTMPSGAGPGGGGTFVRGESATGWAAVWVFAATGCAVTGTALRAAFAADIPMSQVMPETGVSVTDGRLLLELNHQPANAMLAQTANPRQMGSTRVERRRSFCSITSCSLVDRARLDPPRPLGSSRLADTQGRG